MSEQAQETNTSTAEETQIPTTELLRYRNLAHYKLLRESLRLEGVIPRNWGGDDDTEGFWFPEEYLDAANDFISNADGLNRGDPDMYPLLVFAEFGTIGKYPPNRYVLTTTGAAERTVELTPQQESRLIESVALFFALQDIYPKKNEQ